MLQDNITFNAVERKFLLCIAQGNKRMPEGMELAGILFDVPVIEEIVMEQTAPYKTAPVHPQVQELGKSETYVCHTYGMLVAIGGAMLDKITFCLHPWRMEYVTSIPEYLFYQTVLCFNIPHI
jgi:hypothetical protein